MLQKAKQLEETLEKLNRIEGVKKELEEQNLVLKRERDDMYLQMQTEQVRRNRLGLKWRRVKQSGREKWRQDKNGTEWSEKC